MNRKITFLIVAASLIGLVNVMHAAEAIHAKHIKAARPAVQKMETIVVSADSMPSRNAVKMERMVVTAKRDLSDLPPTAIARTEATAISAPASL